MIENAGYGAGGGFVGAVLAYLGFKQRMDRVDKDVAELESRVVFRDTCGVCHSSTHQRLDSIEKKLDILLERNGYK